MKKLFALAVAFTALAVVPASAYAAAGDYAKNSKIYSEFLANCPAAKGDTPTLKDEAAVRIEKLYKTNKSQYELQIKGCQMAVPAYMRQASNIPPAAYVGASAMMARMLGHRNRRPHEGYRNFENVADDSLHVHTKSGKDFDLGNVHAGNRQCLPPRQLHRSERCTAIPGGGVNCKFDCY